MFPAEIPPTTPKSNPRQRIPGDDGARRLDDILNLIPNLVFELDQDARFLFVSHRASTMLGYAPERMLGKPLSAFGRFADGREAPVPGWHVPMSERSFLALTQDGSIRHLSINAIPLFGEDGTTLLGVRATALDVTEKRIAEEKVKKLAAAVRHAPSAVMITDRYGIIDYVNEAFVTSSGFAADEVIGRTPALLKSGQMPPGFYRDMWLSLLNGQEWRGEIYNRRKTGEGYWERAVISPVVNGGGEITHFVAVKDNITERKQFEEELIRQGYEDDVTGLPNRMLAMDRLEQALARARRNGTRVALLSVDIDHFKRVNDALGHSAGDRILREVGERLVSLVRPEDTVARLGGDEFYIVVGECQPSDVETFVQRIMRSFIHPFDTAGEEIFITPSIGVTLFPDDGRTGGDLLRNVDAALFRAKDMGRNMVQFFTPELNARAAEHARLETALHHALERGEISMHYQPMVDLTTGQVNGAEALMRWTSPEFGSVPPDRFIPLAESSGLIVRLGEFAMITACRQACEWVELFGPAFRMAVNVSTRQVRHADFARMVCHAIAEAGISPKNLEIEITESLILDDRAPVQELVKLRDIGVRLSIDDFGTGYSALSYLRRFPVDTLKIDRSFLSNLPNSGTDVTLVESIISMAHCLGLEVVAEGVETQNQLSILKGQRCNLAQGYLISRPVPAPVFLDTLAEAALARLPLLEPYP